MVCQKALGRQVPYLLCFFGFVSGRGVVGVTYKRNKGISLQKTTTQQLGMFI